MIRITIKFGTNNSFTKDYNVPVTVQQVLNDAEVSRRLGFEAAKVTGSIGNVEQPGGTTLVNGDVLVVTSKPCGKA